MVWLIVWLVEKSPVRRRDKTVMNNFEEEISMDEHRGCVKETLGGEFYYEP